MLSVPNGPGEEPDIPLNPSVTRPIGTEYQGESGGSIAGAGKLMPVLPKLEKREDHNKRTKTPMPEAKMILMGIVENERRSSKPEATRELSDVFPAALAN